jgi:F-type H+-transporting ATPase subunit delta
MAGTRAAIRYAKAILDLANGVAEAVDTDMKSIADNYSNEELNTFIQNPTTRVEVKEKLLEILLALMELLKVCFIYYLRISVLKF